MKKTVLFLAVNLICFSCVTGYSQKRIDQVEDQVTQVQNVYICPFDDHKGRELEETKRVVGNMDTVLINGTQLLLEGIYDDIGFSSIPDEILRLYRSKNRSACMYLFCCPQIIQGTGADYQGERNRFKCR